MYSVVEWLAGTKTASISNGASQSGELDLKGVKLLGIIMPSAWTAANITFLVSDVSGGTFVDLYDDGGTEVALTVGGASRGVGLRSNVQDLLSAWRFVKLRSGTTGTPVNQGAARSLILVTKN